METLSPIEEELVTLGLPGQFWLCRSSNSLIIKPNQNQKIFGDILFAATKEDVDPEMENNNNNKKETEENSRTMGKVAPTTGNGRWPKDQGIFWNVCVAISLESMVSGYVLFCAALECPPFQPKHY